MNSGEDTDEENVSEENNDTMNGSKPVLVRGKPLPASQIVTRSKQPDGMPLIVQGEIGDVNYREFLIKHRKKREIELKLKAKHKQKRSIPKSKVKSKKTTVTKQPIQKIRQPSPKIQEVNDSYEIPNEESDEDMDEDDEDEEQLSQAQKQLTTWQGQRDLELNQQLQQAQTAEQIYIKNMQKCVRKGLEVAGNFADTLLGYQGNFGTEHLTGDESLLELSDNWVLSNGGGRKQMENYGGYALAGIILAKYLTHRNVVEDYGLICTNEEQPQNIPGKDSQNKV